MTSNASRQDAHEQIWEPSLSDRSLSAMYYWRSHLGSFWVEMVRPCATYTTAASPVPRPQSITICLGHASLFATSEGGLHFFEGSEIFLEPIDMLLDLADG
jgi:hypothetical protein